MDPAVASIVSAVISAVASIVAARMGRSPSPSTAAPSAPPLPVAPVDRTNRRAWAVVVFGLSLWLVFSPVYLHWDYGATNFMLIPVVTLLAAAVWPIRPAWVVAAVLLFYAINFLIVPLEWLVKGARTRHFEPGAIPLLLGMAFVNAAVCWALSRWRQRKSSG